MAAVISVENLSKIYRLGVVDRRMFLHDLETRWAKFWGRPDPHAPIIGQGDSARTDKEGHFWALNDVSFTLGAGDTLGVVGRNGAGKSTLLKILSRTTAPSSGCVKTRGTISSILEVGTGFHPELTGRENVFLNGAILGMNRAEVRSKFDEIADFAEIDEFLDTPVKRYSSGMYVRLAFAVAAHLRSEILILDEVLAVGDAKFQKKCLAQMNRTVADGRTVIFVSHNAGAVLSFCKRVIVLDGGKTAFDGAAAEGMEYYQQLTSGYALNPQEALDNRLQRASGAVRFTDVRCYGENGEESWRFQGGETVTIQLTAEVHEPQPDIGFYCALKADNDGDLTACFAGPITRKPLVPGDRISFRFLLPTSSLQPRTHHLYLALGNAECSEFHDVLDTNVGLPPLLIQPLPSDTRPRGGYFHLPGRVERDPS
jgi:lipopolysaccharide transport system ATP-binding protein